MGARSRGAHPTTSLRCRLRALARVLALRLALRSPVRRASCDPTTSPRSRLRDFVRRYHRGVSPLDYLGVNISTIVEDNVAIRCDGCHEVIAGTPWRMKILDVVAAET